MGFCRRCGSSRGTFAEFDLVGRGALAYVDQGRELLFGNSPFPHSYEKASKC